MRLTTAMLANYAEVRDSLLFICGGSPEWWTLTAPPPTVATLHMATMAEWEPDEIDRPFEMQITLLSPSGEQRPPFPLILPWQHSEDYVAGAPLYRPLVFQFPVEFHEVGRHSIRIAGGNDELALIHFGVRVLLPPS